MPTYDYKCNDCDYEFEKFQSMKDAPISVCPQCGGKVSRLISSGAGLLFKGKGFYETDYKKKDTCCSKGESCDSPKKCCEN